MSGATQPPCLRGPVTSGSGSSLARLSLAAGHRNHPHPGRWIWSQQCCKAASSLPDYHSPDKHTAGSDLLAPALIYFVLRVTCSKCHPLWDQLSLLLLGGLGGLAAGLVLGSPSRPQGPLGCLHPCTLWNRSQAGLSTWWGGRRSRHCVSLSSTSFLKAGFQLYFIYLPSSAQNCVYTRRLPHNV